MSTATAVNKELLRAVRVAVDAALIPIAKAHGLTSLTTGKAIYDPRGGTFTIKLDGVAEGGTPVPAQLYNLFRESRNLPEIGATFTHGGKQYKIDGANSTGSKVLAARQPDGKQFLFHPEDVARLCAKVGGAA